MDYTSLAKLIHPDTSNLSPEVAHDRMCRLNAVKNNSVKVNQLAIEWGYEKVTTNTKHASNYYDLNDIINKMREFNNYAWMGWDKAKGNEKTYTHSTSTKENNFKKNFKAAVEKDYVNIFMKRDNKYYSGYVLSIRKVKNSDKLWYTVYMDDIDKIFKFKSSILYASIRESNQSDYAAQRTDFVFKMWNADESAFISKGLKKDYNNYQGEFKIIWGKKAVWVTVTETDKKNVYMINNLTGKRYKCHIKDFNVKK